MPKSHRDLSAITITQAATTLVVIVILAAGIVMASEIVLTLFLAVLFGIFLTSMSKLVSEKTSLSRNVSLAVVVITLVALSVGICAMFWVQLDKQLEQASGQIDKGVASLQELAESRPSIRSTIASVPFLSEALGVEQSKGNRNDKNGSGDSNEGRPDEGPPPEGPPADDPSGEGQSAADENSAGNEDSANNREAPAKSAESGEGGQEKGGSSSGKKAGGSAGAVQARQQVAKGVGNLPPVKQAAQAIGGIFRTTLGLVVNSVLIFFVGLFIASSPATYRDGVVQLVPVSRRERATEVLNELGETLWRWLLGRFGSMLVTGVGAFILLSLLGVPMAATLGIITALLTFVPNIGAAVALMLAMLFALPQGVTTSLLVLPAYLLLQLVESYVVTPLIQQRQVSLPPALLIAFQAIMGVLFGFLGAAVASPLLAATKVTIEKLYVEDVLEKESESGESASPDEESGSQGVKLS